MDDLLKDAIADAKAVRETAITNAKLALEEAFTPKLQNMLSQKIQNEIEIDEDEHEDEDVEEEMDDEEAKEEGRGDMRRDGDEVEEDGHEDSEEVDESEIIEIDGVKYAPVVAEEEHEDEMDEEEGEDMENDADEDELDLEAVIKELESELDEDADLEEGRNDKDEKDEVKEEDEDDKAKDEVKEEEEDDDSKDEVKEDSEFNLDEILDALKEEDEPKEDEVSETSKLKAELEETREAVKFMRDKLNEVNLLNAKLLFTNKLFRAYGLNNEQKMKVVETFDRATNLREVKLVYSTMAETFGNGAKNNIKESKGSASKAVASTKSEKQTEVISEGSALRNRFKKLANII